MNQKDLPELNSSSPLPYPLRSTEEGFVFDTDQNITYEIRFSDDSDYLLGSSFLGNAFTFSIIVVNGTVKHKDPRVEQTVLAALFQTFNEKPDVVITYVCSLSDNQERARSRLFNSWYLRTGKDRFSKLDFINQADKVYTSVIFRRDHPAESEIATQFNQLFAK